jgi:curved DNA-binding protein CbpA
MDDLTQMTLGDFGGEAVTGSHTRVPQTYYRVLDIPVNATRLEIRESYLRLKGTYGSGSAALYSLIDEDEAARHLAEIEAAFRTLSDDTQRADYDREIGVGEQREADRQGAIAGSAVTPRVIESDRYLRMRESAASLNRQRASEQTGLDDATVRTQRSTLSVIKLKASAAGSADMHEKMRNLIAAHDVGDGDLYRQLRELCNVSSDEMQERTKVSIGHLEAIETNRFERLPQAVYVKGFLASYFRYLDVPGYEKLMNAFTARILDWQANKKS